MLMEGGKFLAGRRADPDKREHLPVSREPLSSNVSHHGSNAKVGPIAEFGGNRPNPLHGADRNTRVSAESVRYTTHTHASGGGDVLERGCVGHCSTHSVRRNLARKFRVA